MPGVVRRDDETSVSKDKKERGERQGRRRREASPGAKPASKATALTEAMIEQVRQWASEACAAHGLALYELEAQAYGPWSLRVCVDPPGPYEPRTSVTIDQCALVSRYLEALLDADERVPERYTLEVSSPGIERVLRRPEHYVKLLGARVQITTRQAIQDQYSFKGVLLAFDAEAAQLTLEVAAPADAPPGQASSAEAPAQVVIALGQIKKAHVTFDFD